MSTLDIALESALEKAVRKAIEKFVPMIKQVIERANEERYLTRARVKEMTGWSDRTLQHLRDTEQIDFIKHGRKILYPRDAFYAYLEAGRVKRSSNI